MKPTKPYSFWQQLDALVASHPLVVDRPKGSTHLHYPDIIYPLDYGYLEGTASIDHGGIDVWVGRKEQESLTRVITAVILTVDLLKQDVELKIGLDCDEEDLQTIISFHNRNKMGVTVMQREPGENMDKIPDSHLDLLKDETRAFAFLGTENKDGTLQVTPVWFNTSGDYIQINTARGRLKDKNMTARPDVTLCISDPKDPYRYLQIRGRVVDSTENGANALIDALEYKYTGHRKYRGYKPGMVRVSYKIRIDKVDAHG